MKVWVVFYSIDYSCGAGIIGVYSSKEKAEEALKRSEKEDFRSISYEIVEEEVK